MNDAKTIYFEEEYQQYPWLIFRLQQSTFAINCRYVTSILKKPDDIAPSIQCPEYLEGLINIRGEVIPLINTRKLFMMSEKTNKNAEMTITLRFEGQYIGYSIDEVIAVEDITIISKASETKSLEKSRYLYGVGTKKTDDSTIILLINDKSLLDVVAAINDEE